MGGRLLTSEVPIPVLLLLSQRLCLLHLCLLSYRCPRPLCVVMHPRQSGSLGPRRAFGPHALRIGFGLMVKEGRRLLAHASVESQNTFWLVREI